MGWNPVKKLKKELKRGTKKVIGVHKAAVGALTGSKKLLSSGLKAVGLGGSGSGSGSTAAKPERERYKRKKRNEWKSKSRLAFEAKQKKTKRSLLGTVSKRSRRTATSVAGILSSGVLKRRKK